MKKFINLSASLGFLFFSLSVSAMDTPEESGVERKVPTLQSLAAKAIFLSFEKEAEKDEEDERYLQISKYREQASPAIQELIFSEIYEPDASKPLNFNLISFLSSVDLSNVNKTGTLANILSENPAYLSPLSESKFLRCMIVKGEPIYPPVSKNEFGFSVCGEATGILGAHVRALKDLTNLTHLDVGRNNIGSNSTELVVLQNLTNLRSLIVSHNSIEEEVIALQNLTNLTELDLGWNNIKEEVSTLQNLTNLTHLNMCYNRIGEHVSTLQNLTNLTHLNMCYNRIGENVSALQNLTNLTHLNMRYNRIGENVSALQNLTNIKNLNLD